MRWPDFLVIGAAKSGTSSLYHYLNQHPQIYMCPAHEPNFFALEGLDLTGQFQGPGDREALERFGISDRTKYTDLFSNAPPAALAGEISPLYLYSPHAAKHIRETCPDIKLIAILRHPTERAFSNYKQYRKAGNETIQTFQGALEAESYRIQQGWGPWPFWHYQQVGFYAGQLQRYFKQFSPLQLLVCLYDDLQTNPVGLLQNMFTFLEVDATFIPNVQIQYNVSARPKSSWLHHWATHPNYFKETFKVFTPLHLRTRLKTWFHRWNTISDEMPAHVRAHLNLTYHDDILLLESLLQRDLSFWRND